jgi:hypothetical protein
MKKLVTLAIAISSVSISLKAQDSISVLFIGNSYTYVNDLPTVFLNLTTSLSDIATVDSKTNGGYTFQNHLSDPVTHTKIKSKKWDYVVLQGQSQEPSFPTAQVDQQTLPPAVSLADSMYANWFCSQAMYFMTWGRQNGDPQWDSISTFDGMNVRLRNAYVRIADSANASVCPVGIAWKYVRDTYPSINLYSADGSHPSIEGTYLAACTFYASLFRKTPVGASYVAGLDPAIAGQLQGAAAIAVLDSLSTWNLKAKEDLTVAHFNFSNTGNTVQFSNNSEHATSYLWDFGDGVTSMDMDPSHTFLTDGSFMVQLIAISECGNDTLSSEVQISYWGIDEIAAQFKMYTLGAGKYLFESSNDLVNLFELTDAQGKVIFSKPLNEQESVQLDLTSELPGMFFVRLNNSTFRIIYIGN